MVTGAGGRIGLGVARRLAAEGAKVVCADLDEIAGAAAAEEVGGLFVHTDVTDPYMVEALFDEAYETCGGVDVAFNNAAAALSEDGPVLDLDPDAWRRALEEGLTSVYLCCRSALPYMRRHGRGSIINAVPAAGRIASAAARGGALALTRELGEQFAREGIRVNALSVGTAVLPLITDAAALLAGDDSAFITASEFLVDGGLGGARMKPL